MSPKLQKTVDTEQRRYFRHSLNDWLLFFNIDSIIDMAQVINISQGGALCVSLADDCPPEMIEGLELYGPDIALSVNGLCGRIVHTDYNRPSSASPEEISCFIFGLQFFQITPDQATKIEQITRNRR